MDDQDNNDRILEELDARFPPPVDRVDSVLDVACSVLADYGSGPGATRIERLARWIAANLDASPTLEQTGWVSRFWCARSRTPGEERKDLVVWRIGSLICVEVDGTRSDELTADEARELATVLFRAAEKAED